VAPQGDQPALSLSLIMNSSMLSDPRTAPENNSLEPRAMTMLTQNPTITSLNPNAALVGGPNFILTVIGENFSPDAVVQWKGFNRQTTFISSKVLTAQIPASDIATIGQMSVRVLASPKGVPTNPLDFMVVSQFTAGNQPPVISRISPSHIEIGGAGFKLALTGSDFQPDSIVRWNGEDRTTTFVPATPQSSARLEIFVLDSDIVQPGIASLTVFNPNSQRTSNARFFTRTNLTIKSAASLREGEVAIGSIAFADDSSLAVTTAPASSIPLPTKLPDTADGSSVEVIDSDGVGRPAGIHAVSPRRVRFQIPSGSALEDATVKVKKGASEAGHGETFITRVTPGLFAANGNGQGVAFGEAIRNGASTTEPISMPSGGGHIHVPINLGLPADRVVLRLFATGIRHSLSASAKIKNENAPVISFGARPNPGIDPQFVGMDQIEMVIPRSLIGKGIVEVIVTVDGGKESNRVTVQIR
jgi:uncharacterized protein (TIGR03437 family)